MPKPHGTPARTEFLEGNWRDRLSGNSFGNLLVRGFTFQKFRGNLLAWNLMHIYRAKA